MVVRLGALEISPEAVLLSGEVMPLRPVERHLLAHLAQNERVHTRESLLREPWMDARNARSIDVHIWRIRQVLGEAGNAIVTVRRVGYRLDPSRL